MRYYVWDRSKAVSNRRKHGIEFEEAIAAFDDPDALTTADRIEGGEQRWQTLGNTEGGLIFLAHTEEEDGGDEIVRIVSARRPSRQERRNYEAAFGSRHRR